MPGFSKGAESYTAQVGELPTQPSWDEEEKAGLHPSSPEQIKCLLLGPLTFNSCSALPSHPLNSHAFQVKGNTTNRKMADYMS